MAYFAFALIIAAILVSLGMVSVASARRDGASLRDREFWFGPDDS